MVAQIPDTSRTEVTQMASLHERAAMLQALHQLVEPLSRALPGGVEVVLHNLEDLPNSIVAIHGNLTGRKVGDPATDMLLEQATSGTLETNVGYPARLPDGRPLRSATLVVRDSAGDPVATLCFNIDISAWHHVHAMAQQMIGAAEDPATAAAPTATGVGEDATVSGPATPAAATASPASPVSAETFVRDVDDLARTILDRAVAEQQVPVDLMRKEHKVAVVRLVKDRGFFLLRDAVEMIGNELGVSRFTIYNYLNEIGDD